MNFRTLDLNLLRVFAAVMVERNVTRAAAQLAMTQPAVSNALRRLREALGDELFVTVPSGVLPTVQAEAVWPDIRIALERLSDALDPQVFHPTRDERSFTMAMADATATVLMPAFVASLAREQARADVRVLPLSSRDPRAQLEHGAADVAVGFFPEVAAALAGEGPRAMLVLDPLYRCEYVCVMRRDHPLERRVVLTVNQFSTAARVVHDADLLTVLPRSFVAASGLAEGLTLRRFPGALPTIEVGLLWHRRHERDKAQRWLRDTFSAAARGLGIAPAAVAHDKARAPAAGDSAVPVAEGTH